MRRCSRRLTRVFPPFGNCHVIGSHSKLYPTELVHRIVLSQYSTVLQATLSYRPPRLSYRPPYLTGHPLASRWRRTARSSSPSICPLRASLEASRCDLHPRCSTTVTPHPCLFWRLALTRLARRLPKKEGRAVTPAVLASAAGSSAASSVASSVASSGASPVGASPAARHARASTTRAERRRVLATSRAPVPRWTITSVRRKSCRLW